MGRQPLLELKQTTLHSLLSTTNPFLVDYAMPNLQTTQKLSRVGHSYQGDNYFFQSRSSPPSTNHMICGSFLLVTEHQPQQPQQPQQRNNATTIATMAATATTTTTTTMDGKFPWGFFLIFFNAYFLF